MDVDKIQERMVLVYSLLQFLLAHLLQVGCGTSLAFFESDGKKPMLRTFCDVETKKFDPSRGVYHTTFLGNIIRCF